MTGPNDQHAEYRRCHKGGAVYLVVEGVLWLLSAALGAAGKVPAAMLVLLVGGLSLLSFVAITRPDMAALLFRDLMYVPTLVASVWLSWGAASRVPHSGLSRVLAWVVVFSLCHLAAFVILTVANGSAFDLQVAYAATRVGGLVGLGVGLGVYFASRPWLQVDKVLENQGRWPGKLGLVP